MANIDTIKALGVKDCVNWLRKEIKDANRKYEFSRNHYGVFDSQTEKTRLDTLVNVKISLEKYAKKLNHQALEGIENEQQQE